jgi:predicted thioesterase
MKEEDEEGIGTFLTIEHQSPSLVNNQVIFTATVEHLSKNEIICSYEAKVGERLIAFGKQGQKILKKEKINQIFNSLIV